MNRNPSGVGIRSVVVAALLCVATTAFAQGYEVTPATGKVEARPAAATRIAVDSSRADRATAVVPLPFRFRYYGEVFTSVVVSAHGWVQPGAERGFDGAADPTAPHGQDAASGAFPYIGGAGTADGVIAPLWTTLRLVGDGSTGPGNVWTWVAGEAPARRFVVSWDAVAAGPEGRMTFQVHLHEGPGRIVFAYSAEPYAFPATGTPWVLGLDEPEGKRSTAPLGLGTRHDGPPPSDFVFEPRTVHFNDPRAAKATTPVAWEQGRREVVTAPGSAEGANYVGKGRGWFFVPDRAIRIADPESPVKLRSTRLAELAAEDLATFGGKAGDPVRWVKQVLDGKVTLLPRDGTDPVRVWFRIVEWFTIDDTGSAGHDDHIWNLRRMLHLAFPGDDPRGDPRGEIDHYVAWRAQARSRLSVVKLFDRKAPDDAARQFDTGRANEYVLWCGRLRPGPRGRLGKEETPGEGWIRFFLLDHDEAATQFADRGNLRDVPDPNYVAGGYEYTIRNGHPLGWEALPTVPAASLFDEEFEADSR